MKSQYAFFALIGVIASVFLEVLLRGYTVSKLWLWFVVAPFHVPAVSLVQAIGLCLVVSVFKYRHAEPVKSEKSATLRCVESFLAAVLFHGFALLLGLLLRP